MVSICLSRALLVTGKQSVSRRPAWRNPAGLGTIGRVMLAVRFENETQSVSRCTARDLPASWATAVLTLTKTQSGPSISYANSDD